MQPLIAVTLLLLGAAPPPPKAEPVSFLVPEWLQEDAQFPRCGEPSDYAVNSNSKSGAAGARKPAERWKLLKQIGASPPYDEKLVAFGDLDGDGAPGAAGANALEALG